MCAHGHARGARAMAGGEGRGGEGRGGGVRTFSLSIAARCFTLSSEDRICFESSACGTGTRAVRDWAGRGRGGVRGPS